MIEVPSTLSQRRLRVSGTQGGPVEFVTLGSDRVLFSIAVDGDSAREIASFLVNLVGVVDARETIARIAHLSGLEVKVNRKPPAWQTGDVVRIRDGGSGRWLTALVCSSDRVQFEDGDEEDVAWLSGKYRVGEAQLVLRSGEPVAVSSDCKDC